MRISSGQTLKGGNIIKYTIKLHQVKFYIVRDP